MNRHRHVRSPTRAVLVPIAMDPARTTPASNTSPRASSAARGDRLALVRSPRRSATPKKMSMSDGSTRLATTRAKRALFPPTTTSPRGNAPISPVEQASRMLRATTHRTFASSALASTPSPRRKAATSTTPTKTTPDFAATTPMSKHVRTLVKDAMTSLKKGRSRLEELVRSHGRGLNFNDAGAAESPVVAEERAVTDGECDDFFVG